MTELHLILARHLSQLEVDKAGIEHAMNEIQRRFALLDEVESWGLLVEEEPCPDFHPDLHADFHRDDSRHDGYENQDNYEDSEEAVGFVPAGYF